MYQITYYRVLSFQLSFEKIWPYVSLLLPNNVWVLLRLVLLRAFCTIGITFIHNRSALRSSLVLDITQIS